MVIDKLQFSFLFNPYFLWHIILSIIIYTLYSQTYQLNLNTMNNILYIIAIILLIGWVIGEFVFTLGSMIHILLVLAVIAVLIRIVRGGSI